MACAFIGAAIDHFLTPPLPIAHAITLRTSPPQGHPNTTLLGLPSVAGQALGLSFSPRACPSIASLLAQGPCQDTERKQRSICRQSRQMQKKKGKARPQRRRLSKGLRPSRRKKGGVTRNAHGSSHLGFANGAWPPDRSAATKIYETVRRWRPRPGRLQNPFRQPGRQRSCGLGDERKDA